MTDWGSQVKIVVPAQASNDDEQQQEERYCNTRPDGEAPFFAFFTRWLSKWRRASHTRIARWHWRKWCLRVCGHGHGSHIWLRGRIWAAGWRVRLHAGILWHRRFAGRYQSWQ